jgi:alpha-ribazole phosphatase
VLRWIFVRHGETAWNADGRYQGQADVPLSAVGRQQAEAVARRLASEALTAIHSSDLRRAHATAETIAAHHDRPVQLEPRLREVCFGQWQGLTYAQMAAQFPDQVARWNADRVHRAPPGGETLAQVAARVAAALDDVRAAYDDGTVLLVAHGGTIRAALCTLLNKSPGELWQFSVGNTALTTVEFHRLGPVLHQHNDTHHLLEAAPGRDKIEAT